MDRRRLLPTYHFENRTGKNLLDVSTSQPDVYIDAQGMVKNNTAYDLKVSAKIYVEANKKYTYSGMGNVQEKTVNRTGYQYDDNDNPLGPIEKSTGVAITFTTYANTSYVLLQYRSEQKTPMLEKGSIATPYEPYCISDYGLVLSKSVGKDLRDYKIYGNSYQKLPQEYQPVEYIESTGTQYIDLGLKPASTGKVSVKMMPIEVDSNYLCGTRYDNTYLYSGIMGSKNGSTINATMVRASNTSTSINAISTITRTANHIYEIEAEAEFVSTNTYRTKLKVKDITDGIEDISYGPNVQNPISVDQNMLLFATNKLSIIPSTRVYMYKYWDNDRNLVRDLIPCYRKSDNVIGMYDLVEGKFYTNKRTGTFTKGDDVVPTPDNPIEIQSVGEYKENLFKPENITESSIKTITYNDKEYEVYNVNGYNGPKEYGARPNFKFDVDMKKGKSYIVSVIYMGGDREPRLGSLFMPFQDINGGSQTFPVNNNATVYNAFGGWSEIGIMLKRYNFKITPTEDIAKGELGYYYSGHYMYVLKDSITIEEAKDGQSEPSEYEAFNKYKIPINVNNQITNIYLDEPLRKFDDTYYDYIDFKEGKLHKNVAYGVLPKTGWSAVQNRGYISSNDFNNKGLGLDNLCVKSNYFQSVTWNNLKLGATGIASYSDNRIDIKNGNIFATKEDIENWLSDKEVTYLAPRISELITDIDLPNIPTPKGSGIISVDTLIQPSQVNWQYYRSK